MHISQDWGPCQGVVAGKGGAAAVPHPIRGPILFLGRLARIAYEGVEVPSGPLGRSASSFLLFRETRRGGGGSRAETPYGWHPKTQPPPN